jgi:CMP/dCMP kinase
MTVVTISRELGSEGTRIAEAVAQALDTQCVDKEVLAEMAIQAGVDIEVVVQAEERLLSRPAVVSSEMQGFFSRGQKAQAGAMNEQTYIQQMSGAIRALADRGDFIFVGRGSQIILRDHPGALHVHLYAAPEVRAGRIQKRRGLADLDAGLRVIRQADQQRREWYHRFFQGADWKNLRNYHLLIDTGHIPAQQAGSIIVYAARNAQSGS